MPDKPADKPVYRGRGGPRGGGRPKGVKDTDRSFHEVLGRYATPRRFQKWIKVIEDAAMGGDVAAAKYLIDQSLAVLHAKSKTEKVLFEKKLYLLAY